MYVYTTKQGKNDKSTRWLRRAASDQYRKLAVENNYACRSAYKLIHLNEKFHLLKKGMTVVDCGAFPGGWSQVYIHTYIYIHMYIHICTHTYITYIHTFKCKIQFIEKRNDYNELWGFSWRGVSAIIHTYIYT